MAEQQEPTEAQNNSVPDEIVAFRLTLNEESDRGCALMAAAYLDSELEVLLRGHFVEDGSIASDLLGQSKPLGTFSSRIDVVHALGGICKMAHRDLHLIRKIRNDFGHTAQPLDFSHPTIKSRCSELRCCFREADDPPRARFTSAVLAVLAHIHMARRILKRAVAPPDVPISQELRAKVCADADAMRLKDMAKEIENCFAEMREVTKGVYAEGEQERLIQNMRSIVLSHSPELTAFLSPQASVVGAELTE